MRQEKVLDVLRGTSVAKRPRGVTVDLYLYEGGYTIQIGGRVVAQEDGTPEQGRVDAEQRAKALAQRTGKAYYLVNTY